MNQCSCECGDSGSLSVDLRSTAVTVVGRAVQQSQLSTVDGQHFKFTDSFLKNWKSAVGVRLVREDMRIW